LAQEIASIGVTDLVDMARRMKDGGWRFVTLTATELDEDSIDVIYSFDKDYVLEHYRVAAPKGQRLPSISSVYFAATFVENEIQDQFALLFDGLAVDFERRFLLDEDVRSVPLVNKQKIEPKRESAN
jgi:ech hydrogenase subunit D